MKRNLLILAAAGVIALGGFVVVQAEPGHGGGGCWHGRGFTLERFTKGLDLTVDQQAKIQPILGQAKPQIAAIHEEAMQKMKTVIDSTTSQIRPLLTPEQQKKFDAIEKAHQDMMNAQKVLHEATQE
jgi:Spy/CpxP family protein refolding chaperone